MKKRSRLLSALLCMVMVLSLAPALGTPALAAPRTVSVIKISGAVPPVAGKMPDNSTLVAVGSTAYIEDIGWFDRTAGKWLSANGTFIEGHEYQLHVYLLPVEGYVFNSASNMSATVNGETAKVLGVYNKDAQRCVILVYTALPADPGSDGGESWASEDIAVTGIDAPVLGAVPDITAEVSGDGNTVASVSWEPDTGEFLAGTAYSVRVNLERTDGARFMPGVRATINGEPAVIVSGENSQELKIRYDFPALAPATEMITITYEQNPVEVGVGQKVTLRAYTDLDLQLVDSGAVFQWYRAGGNIYGTGTPIPGATDFTLTVPTDEPGTSYYYFSAQGVIMGVPFSSVDSDSEIVMVTVIEGLPVITRDPVSVNAVEGDTVTFTVAAAGEGLHYKWWVADAGMPEGIGTDSPVLTLKDVSAAQYHGYDFWCVVSNATGTVASETAHLSVYHVVPFTDVPRDAWYYTSVAGAHQMGLINGTTATTYAPTDNMTYAEAVKLAACMHQLYHDGEVTLENGSPYWYSSYFTYCRDNGIIPVSASAFEPGYTELLAMASQTITRAEYALLFSRALPEEALPVINDIPDESIPDVTIRQSLYGQAIYKLYRAGIVNGTDAKGTFMPDSYIQRSEVAAVIIRMMDPTARVGAPSELGK